MIDFVKEEKEFDRILGKFEAGLQKLRTGRASSAVLETILVEAYGSLSPLSHIAALSSPDPKSIVIKPWDKTLLIAIQSALEKANLGISIIAEGDQIKANFPAPTEERRKELVRLLQKEAEETRILLRRRRDEIWKTIQEEEKSKLISEDQKFRDKGKMEKLITETNEKIGERASKKEREIMTI